MKLRPAGAQVFYLRVNTGGQQRRGGQISNLLYRSASSLPDLRQLQVFEPPAGAGHPSCPKVHAELAGRIPALLGILLTTLFGVSAAFAQPVPKLTAISPEWIQRGTTLQVVFTGENLGSVTNFIFSGEPGLSATNVPPPTPAKSVVTIESDLGGISRVDTPPPKDEKRLVASVTASADATMTIREVRVVTPTGVSNPLLINVGHLPEVAEKEPNNTIEQAQVILLPAAISGVISASAQSDYYRFKATKGQELVFEVDASRRGSPLDSSLSLLNSAGKELARNEDYNGLDSFVAFAVPDDGEYILQLRDFRYQGAANYTYRLYAGALPYVDSFFPLGGQRGKQVEVALKGRNLAGTTTMVLNLAPKAPLGRQEIRAHTPNGYSNLRPFDVSDLPDFLETEPNNTIEKANVVSIPIVINGRIAPEKDIDRFKFKSDKDQKLVCDVVANRFGSKLDSLLTLTDAAGALIAQNDDAVMADARIEFDAKKDVDYILSLRDLTERGGEEFGYRLSIRAPAAAAEAGFEVRFSPDTLRVSRGSHSRIRCEVTPLAGFSGPVRLAFEELPPGIFSEPLFLNAGAPASGLMLVSALKDAPLGNFPLKLIGTGATGGKTISRRAEPLSADKPVREAFLTVLEPPPFTLELMTLSASVEQLQSIKLEVLAQRREGFMGDINVSAEGFSAGKDPITKSFEVKDVVLKAANALGKISLKPKVDSEVGTRTIILKGNSVVDGQPISQYSGTMPITILQIPFVVSSTLTRLLATALPTNGTPEAAEVSTAIKVERRAGFTNEVLLAIDGLPAGIKSTLQTIPANGTETNLKLVATEKAAAGTNTFTIVGTGLHNDRTYKHRSAPISLVISVPEPMEPPAKPAATAAVTPVAGAAKNP